MGISEASKISNVTSYSSNNIQNMIENVKDDEFQKKLQSAISAKDEEALKKAAKDLESVFLNDMFKEMEKTIDRSSSGSVIGSEMYRSMFYENIAKEISKGKGIGIADMIYKQMTAQMKNQYKAEEK